MLSEFVMRVLDCDGTERIPEVLKARGVKN